MLAAAVDSFTADYCLLKAPAKTMSYQVLALLALQPSKLFGFDIDNFHIGFMKVGIVRMSFDYMLDPRSEKRQILHHSSSLLASAALSSWLWAHCPYSLLSTFLSRHRTSCKLIHTRSDLLGAPHDSRRSCSALSSAVTLATLSLPPSPCPTGSRCAAPDCPFGAACCGGGAAAAVTPARSGASSPEPEVAAAAAERAKMRASPQQHIFVVVVLVVVVMVMVSTCFCKVCVLC